MRILSVGALYISEDIKMSQKFFRVGTNDKVLTDILDRPFFSFLGHSLIASNTLSVYNRDHLIIINCWIKVEVLMPSVLKTTVI